MRPKRFTFLIFAALFAGLFLSEGACATEKQTRPAPAPVVVTMSVGQSQTVTEDGRVVSVQEAAPPMKVEPGKLVRLNSNKTDDEVAWWIPIAPIEFDDSNFEALDDGRLLFASPVNTDRVVFQLGLLSSDDDGNILPPRQTRVVVEIAGMTPPPTTPEPGEPPTQPTPPALSELIDSIQEFSEQAAKTLKDPNVAESLSSAWGLAANDAAKQSSLTAAGALVGASFEQVMRSRPISPNNKDWLGVFRIPFNDMIQGAVDGGTITTPAQYAQCVKAAAAGLNAGATTVSTNVKTVPLMAPPAAPSTLGYSTAYRQQWTWPGGTRASLIDHLANDSNHRIPLSVLQSLDIATLRALHNSDHDGIADANTGGGRTFTIQSPIIRATAAQSNCPGGVCPTPNSYGGGLLRGIFRR